MKSADDLHALVKALTKSEKRHFRLYATKLQSEDDAVYLLLFDALDAMEEYDEAGLRAIVLEEQRDHLPQLKYYLYRTLLRALNQYHSRFCIESRINELLQAFNILYDKQLYGQCVKVLAKARRLTAKYDSPPHLFQVLGREYRLALIDPNRITAESKASCIFDELVRMSESLALRYKCWRTQTKMFLLTKEGSWSSDRSAAAAKGEQLLNDLLPLDIQANGDPFTTLLYLFTQMHFRSAVGMPEEACDWGRKLVQHIESVPQLRSRAMTRYIPALYNYCLMLVNARRLEEFREEYAKLQRVVVEVNMEKQQFSDFHIRMLEPEMMILTGEFERATAMLRGMEEEFMRLDGSLRIGFAVNFNYLFAYSYFGTGEYGQALRWLNNILNDRNVATHEDIHSMARIVNLLIHYELGNVDTLDSCMTSTMRFLTKHGEPTPLDSTVITLLRKLLAARDMEERRGALLSALEKLDDVYRNECMREICLWLDLRSWIESKLERRSFAEIVRRRSHPLPAPHIAPPGEIPAMAAQ